MFCYQCEQTARGEACTTMGVCGKDPRVAALQDLLTHAVTGLAWQALEGRKVGINEIDVNRFIAEAMFTTLTNVNFDPQRFAEYVNNAVELRERLATEVKKAGGDASTEHPCVSFEPATTLDRMVEQGKAVEFDPEKTSVSEDVAALRHLLLFGIRGFCAYAYHAATMGKEDDSVYAFLQQGLVDTHRDDLGVDELLGQVLKCGEVNIRAMELLDQAHNEALGHPEPTQVSLGATAGKAICVSGHDLLDLKALLEQTEGQGINIYTHGEMLPAHGYPELKKHSHLAGHYGTAWQNQAKEFAEFPGSILMTTNCIQRPRDSYADNLFTCGTVGWPGIRHIHGRNFTPLIDRAQELPGYANTANGKTVMVGFAHNAVMGVADKVIQAVKDGAIRHFFLVGGCDGAHPGRNYYTELVEKLPQDCVVLTLACGKFRFFDKELGDIGGIPRLLDVGQCNDAYSAVKIAQGLAGAFNCGLNDLPLSLVLSWYEQKAVAILLSLLYLGVQDMRLGPTLPAFVTPNILNVLQEKFNIRPIGTPEQDIAEILGEVV